MLFEFDAVDLAKPIDPSASVVSIVEGGDTKPKTPPIQDSHLVDSVFGDSDPKEVPFDPNEVPFESNVEIDIQGSTPSSSESPGATETKDPSGTPTEPCKPVDLDEYESDDSYNKRLEKWDRDCRKAEDVHQERVDRLKVEQNAAAIEMENRKDLFKAAKDNHKYVLQALRDSLLLGPSIPKKPERKKLTKKDGKIVETVTEPSQSEEWRSVSAKEILTKEVRGLGRKKRDLLLDTFQTLGQLEDLRAEASKSGKQFHEALPEGIGRNLAEAIENQMLEAIAKYAMPV